jgi:hypothetical protein
VSVVDGVIAIVTIVEVLTADSADMLCGCGYRFNLVPMG